MDYQDQQVLLVRQAMRALRERRAIPACTACQANQDSAENAEGAGNPEFMASPVVQAHLVPLVSPVCRVKTDAMGHQVHRDFPARPDSQEQKVRLDRLVYLESPANLAMVAAARKERKDIPDRRVNRARQAMPDRTDDPE